MWTQHGSTVGAGALATSVVGHAAWFAVGAALAVVSSARSAGVSVLPTGSRLSAWSELQRSPATCLLAALVVYLVASSPLAGPRDLTMPSVADGVLKELLYAAFAALLLSAALAPARAGSLADQLGRHPATHWLGDVSYGVFLWHVLVLQVLFLATGRQLFTGGFWWVLLPVLGLTVALASASAQLVEQPVLRWAHRATASAPAPRG